MLLPQTGAAIVVLFDKKDTIQRAGCQLPIDRLRWLHASSCKVTYTFQVSYIELKNLFYTLYKDKKFTYKYSIV